MTRLDSFRVDLTPDPVRLKFACAHSESSMRSLSILNFSSRSRTVRFFFSSPRDVQDDLAVVHHDQAVAVGEWRPSCCG